MSLILLIIVLVLLFGGRRRLLRISEMGYGRRRRDFRAGPDHPVGFVPVRRIAYVR